MRRNITVCLFIVTLLFHINPANANDIVDFYFDNGLLSERADVRADYAEILAEAKDGNPYAAVVLMRFDTWKFVDKVELRQTILVLCSEKKYDGKTLPKWCLEHEKDDHSTILFALGWLHEYGLIDGEKDDKKCIVNASFFYKKAVEHYSQEDSVASYLAETYGFNQKCQMNSIEKFDATTELLKSAALTGQYNAMFTYVITYGEAIQRKHIAPDKKQMITDSLWFYDVPLKHNFLEEQTGFKDLSAYQEFCFKRLTGIADQYKEFLVYCSELFEGDAVNDFAKLSIIQDYMRIKRDLTDGMIEFVETAAKDDEHPLLKRLASTMIPTIQGIKAIKQLCDQDSGPAAASASNEEKQNVEELLDRHKKIRWKYDENLSIEEQREAYFKSQQKRMLKSKTTFMGARQQYKISMLALANELSTAYADDRDPDSTIISTCIEDLCCAHNVLAGNTPIELTKLLVEQEEGNIETSAMNAARKILTYFMKVDAMTIIPAERDKDFFTVFNHIFSSRIFPADHKVNDDTSYGQLLTKFITDNERKFVDDGPGQYVFQLMGASNVQRIAAKSINRGVSRYNMYG
jgi:hypothetical protein